MMRIATLALFFFCLSANAARAQSDTLLFPDLYGTELADALVQHFKPASVYEYGPARDTLFAKIDSHDDSLTCVYTGWTIWLDPTQDPTQAAYMGGAGINTEHTWPQSKGATGNAKSDMHHLFPTRTDVNELRGSLPFGDIPDQQTVAWLWQDQSLPQPPAMHIDEASEWDGQRFEPREDHKGNVARAMFYFYTMYRDQADAADPDFFWQQVDDLCYWHALDPVDAREYARTWAIAQRQDGKPNPFVLDCSLAERLYCIDLVHDCQAITTGQGATPAAPPRFDLWPNPAAGPVELAWTVPAPTATLEAWDALGRNVLTRHHANGSATMQWQPPADGMYFLVLRWDAAGQVQQVTRRVLVQR